MMASSALHPVNEPEFRISSSADDGIVTLSVVGELDMDTAPQLSGSMAEYLGVHELVVDLSACEFVDSSGIRELLLCRRAIGTGAPMRVVQVRPNVLRTLRLAGLDEVIDVVAA